MPDSKATAQDYTATDAIEAINHIDTIEELEEFMRKENRVVVVNAARMKKEGLVGEVAPEMEEPVQQEEVERYPREYGQDLTPITLEEMKAEMEEYVKQGIKMGLQETQWNLYLVGGFWKVVSGTMSKYMPMDPIYTIRCKPLSPEAFAELKRMEAHG